jgi:hypothetical protein
MNFFFSQAYIRLNYRNIVSIPVLLHHVSGVPSYQHRLESAGGALKTKIDLGVTLTIYLRLSPKLRKRGVTPPLSNVAYNVVLNTGRPSVCCFIEARNV